MKNPLRWIIESIAERNPMYLSHHPTCNYYNHHTFTLYNHQLCMGCFIVYPVAFFSLLIITSAWFFLPESIFSQIKTYYFYTIGSLFVLPIMVNKAIFKNNKKRIRIAMKISLAVGLGIISFPLISRPDNRIVTASLLLFLLIPYLGYKAITALDDCEGCPEKEDFPNCSGLDFEQE